MEAMAEPSTGLVSGVRRLSQEALDARVRPASEKRQGTKSRGVGTPSAPRVLWGFSGGVGLGEVGSDCPPPSPCLEGWVWVAGGTSGAGVAEEGWRCDDGTID